MKKLLWLTIILVVSLSCGSQKTESKPTESSQNLNPELVDLSKKIVSLLSNGDHKTVVSYFDSKMMIALPEDKLKETWENKVIKQFGSFKKQTDIKSSEEQGYKIYLVICEFEKGMVDIKIVYDKDNKVAGLWFLVHK